MRLALVLVCAALVGCVRAESVKIIFGSCMHQDLLAYAEPVLRSVAKEGPFDDFVWLGDAIYGDTRVFLTYSVQSPMAEMQRRYDKVARHAGYQAMLQQSRVSCVSVTCKPATTLTL